MYSGFEPLPPRQSGRGAKRHRVEDVAEPSTAQPAAPSSLADEDGKSSEPTSPLLPYEPRFTDNKLEYLDHTADVQIHSWGDSVGEAFVYSALGMFGYMTDPEGVEIDDKCARTITAKGRDIISLFYNFLDACLFEFTGADDFIAKDMRIVDVCTGGADPSAAENDEACWITVEAFGESFSLSKHDQGTEIKAITYSNMQVFVGQQTYFADGKGDENGAASLGGGGEAEAVAAAPEAATEGAAESGGAAKAMGGRRGFVDAYVIVDI